MATRDDVIRELARRRLAQMRNISPPAGTPTQSVNQESVRGLAQVGANLGASMVLEPIAGIGGMIQGMLPGEEGAAAQRVEQIRGLAPELGPEGIATIQQAGEAIPEPIKNAMTNLGQRFDRFADASAEVFGPIGGAAARTLPVAAAELGGFALGRQVMRASNRSGMISNRRLIRTLDEAAPTIDELRDGSRAIYGALDDIGVRVPANDMRRLASEAIEIGLEEGGPTWSNQGLLQLRALAEAGDDVRLKHLLQARTIAQNSISRSDPHIAARALRDHIDSFINDLDVNRLTGPGTERAGKQIKMARELYRRAKRSEAISEAMENALDAASGFENGLRSQFRALVRTKDKRKFFTAAEIKAMRDVIHGGSGTNLFKKLGKLGFGEGQASRMTTTLLGSMLGLEIGGKLGAFLMPGVGVVSSRLATHLTEKGARLADMVVRAGRDGRAITQAYLRTVPAANRNGRDLASLLVRPDIQLDGIPTNAFTAEALARARNARTRFSRTVAAAGSTAPAAFTVGAGSAASRAGQEE